MLITVNHLAQIGGRKIGDTTRRLSRTLFSKGLSLQLNFAGRSGKVGIGNMKLSSLIVSKSIIEFEVYLCFNKYYFYNCNILGIKSLYIYIQ